MLHIDDVGLYVFPDGIFSDLDVAEALGGHVVGPLDRCCIIVVDFEGLFFDARFE